MTRVGRCVYRLLLLAFPRRMRHEFGPDMMKMLDAQMGEARAAGQGVAGIWLAAILDALAGGLTERLALVRGGLAGPRRAVGRWRWWMRSFVQDLQYGARLLVRQPGFTIVAVLTLALGIGANTALFSAVHAVLLRPLPYPEPDRLVMIWEKRPTEGVFDNVVAPADLLDWARLQRSFDAIAGMTPSNAILTGAGEPVRLPAGLVSPSFFDVLGVPPALGRAFTGEEQTVGRHRVVILGHRIWRERFSASPAVIGQMILLNSVPHEVVGVLPPTFEFPDRTLDLWLPLALEGGATPPPRTLHMLSVYGRLAPGTTLHEARTDMDRVAALVESENPEANRNHGAHVALLRDELQAPVRSGLLTLFAAVGFVLLIACVNVANLLLARAAQRRGEMAVRAAMGAGRWRLAGQGLTESLLLAVLGGSAGIIVAYWSVQFLQYLAPPGVHVLGTDQIRIHPTVLVFTFALSLATGLIFGVLPAWHLARQDAADALKESGRSGATVRRRLRTALVVSEIALASLLLATAGLALRSFRNVIATDVGFRQDHLLTAFVSLPARYKDDGQRNAVYEAIERQFASLPGVRSVGATSHLPLSGQDSRGGIAIEGREPTPDSPTRAHPRAVTPTYFRTMGMRLISGRNFTEADDSESPFVVIVNETMARRYWPGESPVGKRLRMRGPANREVVGIVADVKHWGFERPVNPEVYLPQRQMAWEGLTFVLATAVDPATLTAAVRHELKTIDPDLPLSDVRTMEEVAAASVASRRSAMLLLAIFGTLALVLAAAGIYAVMAQLVALRSAEIGVRMTLGASPATVMRLVLKEGLIQTAAGLAIGTGAAIVVMRAFRSALFDVSPADPLTLAAVALLLLSTALVSCLVPARRAMRVDPVQALRS